MAWDLDDHPTWPDYEYFMWMNTHVFGIITLGGVELPEADAGPDQNVDENTLVNIDGTGSSDPGGSDITYTWTAPSSIVLTDIHAPTPSFVAPDVKTNQQYWIELVVSNDTIASLPDLVTITVNRINNGPIANAGPDTSVYEGDIIYFDGSLSSDSDGDSLSFIWRSADDLQFDSFTNINPIVIAPSIPTKPTYSFSLTVSDGEAYSEPDTIIVSIIDFTSVEDPQASSYERLLIYPNPASQYIHIESEVLISEIEIMDLSGKMLINETLNSKNAELDLSSLSTGFYLVKLKTETEYLHKKIFLRE